MYLKTPILFIIFNRPEESLRVFEQIKRVKPSTLFISADGPRKNNIEDQEKCINTRNLILKQIDWDCHVHKRFLENNLGCGHAVSTAIDWFFNEVEEGIILEDDCVPSISFFYYCSNLLKNYQNNNEIFIISGNNFQKRNRRNDSYYFSAYGHIWGWATWRRAWKQYDFTLNSINDNDFYDCLYFYFSKKKERVYWYELFKKMKYCPIDTWDFQWIFSVWYNKGINIIPNINLVENIGFSKDATHTKGFNSEIHNLKSSNLDKLIHPVNKKINRKADLYTFNNHYLQNRNQIVSLLKKALSLIKN